MRVICTQENLKKGLGIVSNIAGKNVSLPILNNILIRAKEGRLVLISTNLDTGIKAVVRGKIEADGEITVAAKLFNEYVSLLDNKKLELETKENDLIIKDDKQETVIRGQAAEEYPIVPDVEGGEGVIIGSAELKAALSSVVFSASYDDTRPELSGVLFVFGDKNVRFVATDSYRLAEKGISVKSSQFKDGGTKIIPLRALQEVVRILEESGDVKLFFSDNQVVFKMDSVTIISRLIEGNYPDYKQIIPESYKTKAEIERNEFIKVVKAASLFSKAGINDILININKKIEVSSANVNLGESRSSMEAQVSGDKNSIVFNYKYLLDGLQNITTRKINLEVTSSDTPAVMRPVGDDDYLYLIMPIRQ